MKGLNYPKSNRKMLIIYMLLIMLLLTFSGCNLLPVEEEVQTSDVISIKDVDYELYEAKRGDFIYNILGQGIFVSSNSCNCSVEFGGSIIEKVFVKKGDNVKKGDVLVEFDKEDLKYQINEQKLRYEAAKYDYEKEYKLKKSDTEVEKAKLLMSIEEDKLQNLEGQLEKSQLRAPMGGIIIFSEDLVPGQRTGANDVLFIIADPNKLNLMFKRTSSEKEPKTSESLVNIKANTEVKMRYGNNIYEGKIVGMTKSNDGYIIKMNTMPEGAGLGSSVEIILNVINKKNVITIPKKAIKIKNEKFFVVVVENGLRVKKDVEVGAESDTLIEITKGLKDGDKVILN